MTRIKHYFTIILLTVVILILFATPAMSGPGDICNCETDSDCTSPSNQFCDNSNLGEKYDPECTSVAERISLCFDCKLEGETCKLGYNNRDCCGLNCTSYEVCCPNGEIYVFGVGCQPPCVPNCAGKACGDPDTCGGTCNVTCPSGDCIKTLSGYTCCTPTCGSGSCGSNGCGGSCGGSCEEGIACDYNTGTCTIKTECVPNCPPESCSDDGCGASCGPCNTLGGETCKGGLCVTTDMCTCGGAGDCPGQICVSPQLISDTLSCIGSKDTGGSLCVDCAFLKGESCQSDHDCNGIFMGGNCASVTDYQCTDMRCCAKDEMWVGSRSRCEKIICVLPGGSATAESQCCQPPNTPQEQYLNGTHCCPKDYEWDANSLSCVRHEPCYFAGSNPLYCPYRAPDCSYNPEVQWLSTPFNLKCINPSLMLACCFLGEGLFGYITGEDFYYWHEYEQITTY